MILALNLTDVEIWLTLNNLCVLLQYSIVTTAPALGYYKQENLKGLWNSNIVRAHGHGYSLELWTKERPPSYPLGPG